jgi:hypothetical protein
MISSTVRPQSLMSGNELEIGSTLGVLKVRLQKSFSRVAHLALFLPFHVSAKV